MLCRKATGVIGAIALFCFMWEMLSLLVGEAVLPSIASVAHEALGTLSYNRLLASRPELPGPGLFMHVLATLQRISFAVGVGFTIGMSATIGLRLLGGVGHAILGTLDLFRVLPPLMFVPLTVFWMAPGESAILFASTAYAASTYALFALDAFSRADEHYSEMLTILGKSRLRRYGSILIPAALPNLLGGFRLSSAIALGIVLVIEYFIGQVGLGKVIQLAVHHYDVRLILVAIIWSIVIIFALDLAIVFGFRYFRPDIRSA